MMSRLLSRGLALLLAIASNAAVHAAPPPVQAFFERPVFSSAKLAPDGRSVAMLVGAKGARTQLAVLDLQTRKPDVVAAFGNDDVGSFEWVNDKRLVFDLDVQLTGPGRIDAGPGLFAVNRDGSNFRPLVETIQAFVKAPSSGPPLLPWRSSLLKAGGKGQSDEVFVVAPGEVSREKIDYFELRRLNTATGRAVEVDTPLHAFDWVFDAAGELRAVATRKDNRVAVRLRDAAGGWKQIAEYESLSARWIRPRFVGPDGTLYVEAPHGDKAAVFAFDTASGKLAATPLAASKDFDLRADFIANERKLLGLRYTIDAEVTQWLDADMQALQATIDTLLPATGNRVSVPMHGDSPWVLVEAFADVQPTVAYAYHRQTRKLTRLGTGHPDLDPRQMGPTDFVRYKARDGLEIPAYLTLPPGGAKKGLPLVVLVHGGPWVRGASWRFDPEVQFLASRGYAVLQPEFRGSTGYGAKHFEAGFKQWGRAMQDDVADGARWAIAQGIADAKRICIAGASYGGYAALMGLANDPELFRCGINWAGVTDPRMMFSVSWSDITQESKKYGYTRLIGDPVADAAMLKAVSPIENAARIKQPLLLAYGAWDVRVPIVHGEKFRDAVKPHNPNVEWLVYDNEGHGWARPETRIDFWSRVEKFLARHLAAP